MNQKPPGYGSIGGSLSEAGQVGASLLIQDMREMSGCQGRGTLEGIERMRKDEREDVAIQNDSNDAAYYTQVPRIVWAKARNPYDLALWVVVKDIAGQKGECYLGRDDLAALAMMSAGQVSDSRQYLIKAGLLKGELRRDTGYPQPVWHLRVPDLWRENLEWAETHLKMNDRIAFKSSQRKKPSPYDGQTEASLPDGGVLPGDGGLPPHDGGVLPGDAKNNQKKNQKEEEKEPLPASSAGEGDSPSSIHSSDFQKSKSRSISELEVKFSKLTGLPLPRRTTEREKKAAAARWWQPLWRMFETANHELEATVNLMTAAIRQMRADNLTLSAPQSIENVFTGLFAKQVNPVDEAQIVGAQLEAEGWHKPDHYKEHYGKAIQASAMALPSQP